MYEQQIERALHTPHILVLHLLSFLNLKISMDSSTLQPFVDYLYTENQDPEIFLGNLLAIPTLLCKGPRSDSGLGEVSTRTDLVKLIAQLAPILIDELPWAKAANLRCKKKGLTSDEIVAAIDHYDISHQGDSALLEVNFLNNLLGYVALNLCAKFINGAFLQLKSKSVELEKQELYKSINTQVLYHIEILNLYLAPIREIPAPLVMILSPFYFEMKDYLETKSGEKKSIPLYEPFNWIVSELSVSSIIRRVNINCFEEYITEATSFKEVESLVFKMILNDDKPLTHLLGDHFYVLKKLVQLICQNPDSKARMVQLSLLCQGFTLPAQDNIALAEFLLLIYHDVAEVAPSISPLSETVRQLMVKMFLEFGNFSKFDSGVSLPRIILKCGHFDVALAYCIAGSTDLAVHDMNKKQLYYSLIEGIDPGLDFDAAWWKVIYEKQLPVSIYKNFTVLFFPLVKSTLTRNVGRLTLACQDLAALMKQYEDIPADPKLSLMLTTNDKIRIYIDGLTRPFSAQVALRANINFIQSAPKENLPIIFKLMTRQDLVSELFEHLAASLVHRSKKIMGKINVDCVMHKKHFLTELSNVLKKTPVESWPSFSLTDSDELRARVKVNITLLMLIIACTDFKESQAESGQQEKIAVQDPLISPPSWGQAEAALSPGERKHDRGYSEDSTMIQNQAIWIKFLMTLIERILVKGKKSPLGRLMIELIYSEDIHSFLPPEHQRTFLEILRIAQTDWSMSDEKIDYLNQYFSMTPAVKKRHKSAKKSQSLILVTVSEDDSRALSPAESAYHEAHLPDVLTESLSDTLTLCESPSVFSDEQSVLSDEDLLDGKSVRSESVSIDDSAKKCAKIPSVIFYKYVKQLLEQFNQQLKTMSTFQLPDAWTHLVAKANHVHRDLSALYPESSLPSDDSQIGSGSFSEVLYASLDKLSQLDLENAWNKQVAFFCWDLHCAFVKYKNADKIFALTDACQLLNETIQAAIRSLSFCYFKNIQLNYSDFYLPYIELVKSYFEANGFDVWLKGSFVFPEKSRDLDFLIVPRKPFTGIQINHIVQAMPASTGSKLIFSRIDQDQHTWSQRIDVSHQDRHQQLEIDLLVSLNPLSEEELLNITLKSYFSTVAVLWNVNGPACMGLPAARANCGEKRVFKPIVDIEGEAAWISKAPLVAKYLIKFDQSVCYSPEIKQFKARYVNPKTRFATILSPIILLLRDDLDGKGREALSLQFQQLIIGEDLNFKKNYPVLYYSLEQCIEPEKQANVEGLSVLSKDELNLALNQLVELNRNVVQSLLTYLFNRFEVRTQQLLEFIMANELLALLFGLDEGQYRSCYQYMMKYFSLYVAPLNQNLTTPALLAVFLLGEMVDQPDDYQENWYCKLEKIQAQSPSILRAHIGSTINILKILPMTNIEFYIYTKLERIESLGSTFDDRMALLILHAWAPRKTEVIEEKVITSDHTALKVVPAVSRVEFGRFYGPVTPNIPVPQAASAQHVSALASASK